MRRIEYKNFSIIKDSKLTQQFQGPCIYSCSSQSEQRTFEMFDEFYQVRLGHFTFHLKLWRSLRITCTNCSWSKTIPYVFARKVFKNKITPDKLISFLQNKLLISRSFNLYAGLWKVWLLTLCVLISITIIRFYVDPVKVTEPKQIIFEDAFKNENMGKIVKFNAKVDYSLALSKETFVKGESSKIIAQEYYLPLFSPDTSDNFILLRGGDTDGKKIQSRSDVTNLNLLKNQEYSVEGRIELIDQLPDDSMKKYFIQEFPLKRNLNPPKILINSVRLQNLPQFLTNFMYYYIVILSLFFTASWIEIYVDKKIYIDSK